MEKEGLVQKKERERITREEGWFIPPIHEKYMGTKPVVNSEEEE